MNKKTMIRKTSGEMEAFSRNKLNASLSRSGADPEAIRAIVDDVEAWIYDGIPSSKIYSRAFSLLRKQQLGMAARYKLKNAMMELGPTGYPFERLIGEVFRLQGFDVEVGQVLQGHCVTHEVDVIATRGKEQHFIECKYYQSTGKNANVQVPMYIRSRVDDLIRYRKELPQFRDFTFHGWVVTNTRFTSDAVSFGECTGLNLLSWDYPSRGLKELIDEEHIFPVTVLTRLTTAEKHALMDQGIVLCNQIPANLNVLASVGIDEKRIKGIVKEIHYLCPCFLKL